MSSGRERRGFRDVGSPTVPAVVAVYLPAAPAQLALRRLLAGELSLVAVAEVLRVDRSTLYRVLSRRQLRYDAADRIATALGRHPSELWPEWFGVEPSKEETR